MKDKVSEEIKSPEDASTLEAEIKGLQSTNILLRALLKLHLPNTDSDQP